MEENMPIAAIDRFKTVLSTLFMLDRSDLDFGIYRIMAVKRDEIRRFFDVDLLPQVRAALDTVGSNERLALQAELTKIEHQLEIAEVYPESSPKVRELREKLAAAGDFADLEDRVFSRLTDFFSRYYKDGDYMSLRRYKEGVYALPYEGEEVKLYWANADQYYIKSTEYFRDYTFRLDDARRVHFRLVQADTEQNNNKATSDAERRFILAAPTPTAEEAGELVVRFEYRPDQDKRKQVHLNEEAETALLSDPACASWHTALARAAPTEKNPTRTLLATRLADYTARNSFDYFIHKDLGTFLRRELDFFIKSEVMRLDDVALADAPRVEQYLGEVRALRAIGNKVIAMLAQLEDFQKRLWLKKKFVVETQYCVTLDRVPEELYAAIVANDTQRQEWVRLFAIDEIKGNLMTPSYSEPLTVEFLRQNRYLVLDTGLFDECFKEQLLTSFDDLDAAVDGLLIKSENFQALNLLKTRYKDQVKCIYIDPPYNTGNDAFLYKDNYQHSSWLTLMNDRLRQAFELAEPNASLFVSIDDNELGSLTLRFNQ
jgi:adenine-specific DNA-methyltransferase